MFTVCNSYAFGPYSQCLSATVEDEAEAHDYQLNYLNEEWQRQIELNRDPYEVLGDHPPWL